MLTNQLNLNQLRIFESVYRTGSMTQAAKELHLTQSGVSQHIHSLEEALEVPLFERLKKRVFPTPQATKLYQKTQEAFRSLEHVLGSIQGDRAQLVGRVMIGMPPEFGNNVVLPLLSDFVLKHSGVEFNVVYGFASEMNNLLAKGEIHFAFVDTFELHREITTEQVYQEALYLCASQRYLKSKGKIEETREFFSTLDYVSYVPEDSILTSWFKHHIGWKHPKLNVRAIVKDVQGVARLIMSGFGVGILPDHVVSKLKSEGDLHQFEGSDKPLQNNISVAFLTSRPQSHLVWTLIRTLKAQLNKGENHPET